MGSRWVSGLIYLIIIAAAIALIFSQLNPGGQREVQLNQVLADARAEKISRIVVGDDEQRLEVEYKDGRTAVSRKESQESIVSLLREAGVPLDRMPEIEVRPPSFWNSLLGSLGYFIMPLIFLVVLFFFLRQAQGTNNQALSFGKSRARLFTGDKPKVTFADVAAVDEAKQELSEVVEFLKYPEKFAALGARIPRGVLLMGPPGTGKTLLARAVAGEAGVPFFSISGSEFVEMFVGVGASVTGDTPILVRTPEGTRLMPIGEFVDRYYQGDEEGFPIPVEGIFTLGFEERASKFKGSSKRFFGHSAWKQVSAVYRHRVHEIYEIHYLGGVIRTTGDHSVFVRTRNGLVVKEARMLKPGDVLVKLPVLVRGAYSSEAGTPHEVRAPNFPESGVPLYLPVVEEDEAGRAAYAFALEKMGEMSQVAIGRAIGVSQATVGHWQSGRHCPRTLRPRYRRTEIPEQVPVTPALMKLLGYYTAEGRENGSLQFVFGGHEKELHLDCASLMRRVFGLEATWTEDRGALRMTYYSAPLGRFFARYCGNGSHGKHVPEILWDLPREYFLAYLEGCARGDGYLDHGKWQITSVSHPLITELVWLCAMHGIPAGVERMEVPGGRTIHEEPLPEGEAWRLIIGRTSNLFEAASAFPQGEKPYVQQVVRRTYEGYVYDLCGCENEAFFGGEKPILLHNSRVRDLFDQAKRNAPDIVFIDEIDAVGRQRGTGLGGSHDEREQTLNQILVEMDGFDTNTNVIVIAATNRPDILDPALLRPGRFDRRVVLDRPDMRGRVEILKVHVRGKPLAPDVDLEVLARQTPGFSGADLANMVNEAAILAARRNRRQITMADLEEAAEKVIAGPERKSRRISEEEKRIIAYHEAGHALVAHLTPECDPVHKISVVARGMALGYTMALPAEDRHLVSRRKLLADIAYAMGGYAAEQLVLSDVTTGSENDIEQATKMARRMVTEFGMSEGLGPVAYGQKDELVFLGREIGEQRDYSDDTARLIDEEVRRIVEEAYQRARRLLEEHREVLDRIAQRLMEVETLEGKELEALLNQAGPRGQAAGIEKVPAPSAS
ncbi:MAG: ATP-dependent metallopeptidase FtsH/Yme1/Tma family protein [Chloroflexia bacterium]